MKEIIELIEITFDGLENHNPLSSKSLGMFEEGNGLSSHGKAAEWLSKQPPIKVYLGYDGNVYPRIISKRHFLK